MGKRIVEPMKDSLFYQNISSDSLFLIALNVRVTNEPEEHPGEGLSCVLGWIKRNPNIEKILILPDNRQPIGIKLKIK